MKNLIVLLYCILCHTMYSQVSTISSDKNNKETSSYYDERGVIRITLTDTYLQLHIDLDGYGDDYNALTLHYKLIYPAIMIYNDQTDNYNIMFDIESNSIAIPVGGLIDQSTNSIMLFYQDGSSLLYIGEGLTFII